MDTKQCTKCGETKPLDQFHRDKKKLDGRYARCKTCKNASRDLYRKPTDPEYSARWAAANPDYMRAYGCEWRKANPDYSSEYHKLNPHYGWESQYRTRARRYGFEPVVEHFTRADLTARWSDACYLCNGEWDQLEHVSPVSRGGSHDLENCRPVCEPCNRRAWVEYRRAESA